MCTRRQIYGPPAEALNALTPAQVSFLHSLPKAELHAHLNGCIPLSCLQELAAKYAASEASEPADSVVRVGVAKLQQGVELKEIYDFFGLFTAIYALTASPENLAYAARAVLQDFLGVSSHKNNTDSGTSGSESESADLPESTKSTGSEQAQQQQERQCAYLELRSTPKKTAHMTRLQYVETVLDEVEKYAADEAALIVSLDRRMSPAEAHECVDIAIDLRRNGRRVVGVDLCGDPQVC